MLRNKTWLQRFDFHVLFLKPKKGLSLLLLVQVTIYPNLLFFVYQVMVMILSIQSCSTLSDSMGQVSPGLPILHQFFELFYALFYMYYVFYAIVYVYHTQHPSNFANIVILFFRDLISADGLDTKLTNMILL